MSMSSATQLDATSKDDIQDMAFTRRGCCFCFPFTETGCQYGDFGSMLWQRIKHTDDGSKTPSTTTQSGSRRNHGYGWNRGWKKVQGCSEVVAGPKWKTLLRKISGRGNNEGVGKFQYDPLSYSLNFDEGPASNDHIDDDIFSRGFSSRYSIASNKTSMDFDRELQDSTGEKK